MSHKHESSAYKGERPWHGLGETLTGQESLEDAARIAGVDWTVEKRPLFTCAVDDAGRAIMPAALGVSGRFALVRNRDNTILDIVGKRYVPTQNLQALEFFREFLHAGDIELETLGSLDNGRYVWGLGRLAHTFDVRQGDTVRSYVLICAPHVEGKALSIRYTSVRVVCWNTLTAALQNANGFRMCHRREFDARMIAKAKETLGLAAERAQEFEQTARKLAAITLSDADMLRIALEITGKASDKLDVQALLNSEKETAVPLVARRIMESYHSAPGAAPGTAWGALNAVTHYADHVASRTTDARLTQAWMGRTAAMKQQALDLLLA